MGLFGKSSKNAITKEEFTLLQNTARRVISDIAREIKEGNIEVKPVYNVRTKKSACEFCTYARNMRLR